MTSLRENEPGQEVRRPLEGARCWIISEAKAGMDTQTRGLADALGVQYEMKRVSLTGMKKLTSPWGRVPKRQHFGEPGSEFCPPWPALAIATGRAAIPYLRELRHRVGPSLYTVVLLDPQTGPRTADFIWVPEHDRLRGPNVFTTPTSPHGFSPDRISALRASLPQPIADLPQPRIAVLLGGKNGSYEFSAADDARFSASLHALAHLGASFMITPSRRTHPGLLQVTEAATRTAPRILWDGTGDNPYAAFLAHADAFVVTADSVNMTGECCATGRPVYVFHPSGGKAKFHRFHAKLEDLHATRRLPDAPDRLPAWTYPPINSTGIIAREIERRWLKRKAWLASPGEQS
jgi:mitochondrial fission protein ELM1